MKSELVQLFAEMYEHTKDECGKCRVPHSCCSPEYCEMAIENAEREGITLERQEGKIPLLGPNGCIAAPHLRPLCTLHTCDINNLGFKRTDPGGEWDKKYFNLRRRIEEQWDD